MVGERQGAAERLIGIAAEKTKKGLWTESIYPDILPDGYDELLDTDIVPDSQSFLGINARARPETRPMFGRAPTRASQILCTIITERFLGNRVQLF